MTPPGRGAAESHQPGGLRRDAVGGDELLLLADRVEEAEGVCAKADQPDRRDREERDHARGEHAAALAGAPRRQHQERQQQPRRHLHPDTGRQRRRRGAISARRIRRACGQGERDGEHEQDQRVVVRSADREHQQHRVQPHEGRRPATGVPQAPRRPGDQQDRREARGSRARFEETEAGCEPEWSDGVADEREQGAVGGVLEGPAQKLEDGIGGRFGGEVRVRVEPVLGAHAGEGHVAEDVLGEQRGAERQQHVRRDDARSQRAHRHSSRRHQRQDVAGAHDQRQRLEARVAQPDLQACQRARQPVGPATAAGRNELVRSAGGAGGEQECRDDHREQAERAERSQRGRRRRRAIRAAPAGGRAPDPYCGYGARGSDEPHCYPSPSAIVQPDR